MRNPTSRALFRYWNTLRKSGEAPHRNDINPANIRTLLPDLFMLKQDSDGSLRFGLAGTRLYTLFQQELSGKPFSDMWDAAFSDYAERIVEGVAEHKISVVFDIRGECADGTEIWDYEMLLLPLADEQSSHRLIGCISTAGGRSEFSRALNPLEIKASSLIPANNSSRLDQQLERIRATYSR